ncbi:M16 family metallopeptidase [Moraxella cuniculi]|uniref:Peptidase M16 inactive domain n=1 Tax=Moraxella cuniculi TaxID=34061 RepID=A0A3S4SZR5_9GAMM|nr:pitrilysin family protein [Moraxella cuniculi]VEG13498.1 Peptidase M16 inactive domain [Moraxella cuniculi]
MNYLKFINRQLLTIATLTTLLVGLPTHANQSSTAAQKTSNQPQSYPALSTDSIIDSIDKLGELDFRPPQSQYFQTDNGIPVVFTPLTQMPMVDISVHFFAGSAYDEPSSQGVANMVATMLTQGTTTLSEDEFVAKKERLGSQITTSVSKDGFLVSLRSLSDAPTLAQSTSLFADMLTNPAFDTAVLARNKDRLLTSLKQQNQNPAYRAMVAFDQALYGSHGYGQLSTGNESTLATITPKMLMAFKEKYLNANNAVLIITGDMSLETAKKTANELGRQLPKGQSYRNTLPEATPPKVRHIHLDHESTQTQIIIGQMVDKLATDDASRQVASDFALGNSILAGSDFNARLMQAIREQKGYTYGIYGDIKQLQAAGSYAVSFSTDGDKAADAIFDTMDIIKNTLKDGVTQDELSLMYLGKKNGFANGFSSNASIHKIISKLTSDNYPRDHIATVIDRLDKASVDSVNAALAATIKPDEFIIITVGKSKPDLSKLFKNTNNSSQ